MVNQMGFAKQCHSLKNKILSGFIPGLKIILVKRLKAVKNYPPVGPAGPVGPGFTGPVGTSPGSGTSLPQLIDKMERVSNKHKTIPIFFIQLRLIRCK